MLPPGGRNWLLFPLILCGQFPRQNEFAIFHYWVVCKRNHALKINSSGISIFIYSQMYFWGWVHHVTVCMHTQEKRAVLSQLSQTLGSLLTTPWLAKLAQKYDILRNIYQFLKNPPYTFGDSPTTLFGDYQWIVCIRNHALKILSSAVSFFIYSQMYFWGWVHHVTVYMRIQEEGQYYLHGA